MNIFCCTCNKDVEAALVYGTDCYPHRKDLANLKFYQCPVCKNFVGTHKGTDRPLGVIASSEIKKERMKIHDIIDPLWKTRKIPRKEIYRQISSILGYDYHTANLKTVEDCRKVYSIALDIKENCK
jgi:hypothetical protein